LNEAQFDLFLVCPLLLGLLMGLALKVHDGNGLDLEHDLGLGVAQAISLVGITSAATTTTTKKKKTKKK